MRSSQDAIQDKPVRRGATTMPSSRQQRKHPSLYVLRTWAMLCKPVRLTAKVAEEAFEMADEGTSWVILMFEGDNAKELGYDDVDLL